VQRHFALLQSLVNKPQIESLDTQSRTIAASAASLAATAMVIRLTASVASFSAAMQAALAVSARSMRAAEPEKGGSEQ
jgi:TRAP-type mannitol/chloroaromatic compound transport system substrate-binding protein